MFNTISKYVPALTISTEQASIAIPRETILSITVAAAAIFFSYKAYQFNWKSCILDLAKRTSHFQAEKNKFEQTLEESNFKNIDITTIQTQLPEKGIDAKNIIAHLASVQGTTRNGKNSGALYIENPNLDRLILDVQQLAMRTNPLHLNLSPLLRQLETGVVAMTAHLFHGDENVRGNITSGGTSSILHAVYTARERASENGHTSDWTMVVPKTAHPAFDKAAHMFGITIIKAPVHPDGHKHAFKVDIEAMRKQITSSTILVVGSFPAFPHGIIDPIENISTMLEEIDPAGKIGLHLDACLGGFVLPFLRWSPDKKLGFSIPRVTSISADTHKYGYCEKGSSVVMYRDEKWYRRQIFVTTKWPGGIYTSPTFEGSRSGSVIATTWATMTYLGGDYYSTAASAIIKTARGLIEKLRDHPHIKILGNPKAMVLAFASKIEELNIYDVLDEMKKREWYLSPLQNPAAFHLCITMVHAENEEFINCFMNDLEESIKIVLAYPAEKRGKQGEARVYGTNSKFGAGMFVQEIAREYWVVHARPKPTLSGAS